LGAPRWAPLRTPGLRPVRDEYRHNSQLGHQGCRRPTGLQITRSGFAVRREPRTFEGLRSAEGLHPGNNGVASHLLPPTAHLALDRRKDRALVSRRAWSECVTEEATWFSSNRPLSKRWRQSPTRSTPTIWTPSWGFLRTIVRWTCPAGRSRGAALHGQGGRARSFGDTLRGFTGCPLR
jgi:hypothetical protein